MTKELYPDTQSQTAIVTLSLHINALNPDSLMEFYRDGIGLKVLKYDASNKHYEMGASENQLLLEISQAAAPRSRNTTGLYHMAFRLPTEEDLGTILVHLKENNIRLTGASDHGYSHALYLNDPEGNGIEIYWDKPQTKWDKQSDGSIEGIVERLDLQRLAGLSRTEFTGLPSNSDLGHIHLHVRNISETLNFYKNNLGLGKKFIMNGQALFMATRGYHHHLGANIWRGTDLIEPENKQQGLQSYTWLASPEDLAWIKNRLVESSVDFSEENQQIRFKDNSGINIYIRSK